MTVAYSFHYNIIIFVEGKVFKLNLTRMEIYNNMCHVLILIILFLTYTLSIEIKTML